MLHTARTISVRRPAPHDCAPLPSGQDRSPWLADLQVIGRFVIRPKFGRPATSLVGFGSVSHHLPLAGALLVSLEPRLPGGRRSR